jgi:hypothetical protein
MIERFADENKQYPEKRYIYQNWPYDAGTRVQSRWNKFILGDGRSVQKVYANGKLVWPREYLVSAGFLSVCRPFQYIGKNWEFYHRFFDTWSTPCEYYYRKVVCHGNATCILLPTIGTHYGPRSKISALFVSTEPNQIVDFTSGGKDWHREPGSTTHSISLDYKYSANGKAVYYNSVNFYTRTSRLGRCTLNGEPFEFNEEMCAVVEDNNFFISYYGPSLAWLYTYQRMPEEIETTLETMDKNEQKG